MILISKESKNYICIVDGYRRPGRQRNTAGRYRVGAKTAAEAKKYYNVPLGLEVYLCTMRMSIQRHVL